MRILSRTLLIGGAAMLSLLMPATAQAQQRAFDLPAQPATKSIPEFARQAGIQIVAPGSKLRKISTRAIRGQLDVRAALNRLIEGTGLRVVADDGRTVTLGVAPAVKPAPAAVPALEDDVDAGDIVVTAYKREQLLSTVPQGISVVTGTQLTQRGAKSLADFVALTPGVSIKPGGAPGTGSVAIRGIPPLVVAGTVSIYVDDVPISGSGGASRSGLNSPDLDPNDIARIEVLKGPQGTLYGASSLGGVIKYVLEKPSLTKTELNLSEEINMLENRHFGTTLRASGSTPITDRLAVRVSGYYRRDAGFVDNVGPLAHDAVNNGDAWGVRGALYWKPTDNFSVDLSASIQRSVVNGFSSVDLDWQTSKPLFGRDKQERWTPESFRVGSEVYSATLKWDTSIGTFLSSSGLSNVVPRARNDLTYNYAGTGGPIDYATPASLHSKLGQKQFSQEFRFTSNRFGPVEFQAGAFYQHADADVELNYIPYRTDGVPDAAAGSLGQNYLQANLSEYAGFINATAYLSDTLDITAGYRHSRIDQHGEAVVGGVLYGVPDLSERSTTASTEDADTYQFGARWRPNKNLMFYLRAASGYRPGGARNVPPGAPAGLKPFFVSDSIWSYEAGVKTHLLGGRLILDADLFRIDWSDIQTLVYIGPFGITGNGGTARSQGGEVQASFEPTKGLILSGNAAYTDAQFTEDAPEVRKFKGERIPAVPKWTATADISYTWQLDDHSRANIGGTYAYKGSTYDSLGEPYTVPGYATLDVRAGIEMKRFGVSLYINNLTNERAIMATAQGYYSFFNPLVVNVNQPRTYGLRFSQKF